jgi:hypothetical protein
MRSRKLTLRKVFAFIALTFSISTASYIWMIRTASARDVGLFWMWSPGLAAIITQLAFKRSLREFGWQRGPRQYVWLALLIPTT